MNSNERRAALTSSAESIALSISLKQLQEDCSVQRATLYRDIAFLRDVLMAPIELDPSWAYATMKKKPNVSSCPVCGLARMNYMHWLPRNNARTYQRWRAGESVGTLKARIDGRWRNIRKENAGAGTYSRDWCRSKETR